MIRFLKFWSWLTRLGPSIPFVHLLYLNSNLVNELSGVKPKERALSPSITRALAGHRHKDVPE